MLQRLHWLTLFETLQQEGAVKLPVPQNLIDSLFPFENLITCPHDDRHDSSEWAGCLVALSIACLLAVSLEQLVSLRLVQEKA